MTLVHSQSFEGVAVVKCMRPTFTIDAVVLLSDVKSGWLAWPFDDVRRWLASRAVFLRQRGSSGLVELKYNVTVWRRLEVSSEDLLFTIGILAHLNLHNGSD